MLIAIDKLRDWPTIEKVTIHSLDLCLYQASVIKDGEEYFVTDKRGKLLRSFNILDMQTLFETLPVEKMVLRQQSAYDEMVGQPLRDSANALEVPLGNNRLGRPQATIQ